MRTALLRVSPTPTKAPIHKPIAVLQESDFAGVVKSKAFKNAMYFLFDKVYFPDYPTSYTQIKDQIRSANEDTKAGNNYSALQTYFAVISDVIKLSVINPGSIKSFDDYEINSVYDFTKIFLEAVQVPAKRMCNRFFNNALTQLQRNSDEVVKVLTTVYKRQGFTR